jgi:hypothetical protein
MSLFRKGIRRQAVKPVAKDEDFADYFCFAYLGDVYIHHQHRGGGQYKKAGPCVEYDHYYHERIEGEEGQ